MIYQSAPEWIKKIQAGQRLLGIDYGEKRIGLALSDTRLKIASSYALYQSQSLIKDAQHVQETLKKEECWGIVLGFPLNMNGTEGPRCVATKAFASAIQKVQSVPLLLWDERLSTRAMTALMIESDLSRKKRAKSIDKTSASFILQGVLDWIHMSSGDGYL